MDGERVLFDASAYVLIEASGDSEAECFGGAAEAESDAAAEDDAHSCSYGSSSDSAGVREVDAGGDDFSEDDEDGGGGTSEEEEGVVDQRRGGGKAVAKDELDKSKACEDLNVKLMNDRETDRLFWEACLAS